ncbi:MAG: histidine kinase [Chloroflexota bacterium]
MTHGNFLDLCCIGGALFLASNIWFFFRVLQPIRQLSLQADQLTQGKLDAFECQCGGIPEIGNLHRAMAGMVGHVRRAQEQSRAYAERLADGQENERKRIARELHDDTIQSAIAVTQSIDLATNWMKSEPERAAQMLRLAREQAVEIVTHLRNLIGGLRPPALEELGLIAALKMQIGTLHDLQIHLRVEGVPRRLEEARELALFRAAQEALTNVCRHSHATQVDITVEYYPNGAALRVRDNGHGFKPPSTLGELVFQNHYGLLGIQERVSSLDGWIKIDGDVGQGTTLQVYLPAEEQQQPDHLVRDPVCSALIEPKQAYGSVFYQGETHYFCCPVCQGAFQKDPQLYMNKIAQPTIHAP